MSYPDRDRARAALRKKARELRGKGPRYAGQIARVEAILELEDWPPSFQRYKEFCSEVFGSEVPSG